MKRLIILVLFVGAAIGIGLALKTHWAQVADVQLWQRQVSPGQLSAAHAWLESECAACHTPTRSAEGAKCIGCHACSKVCPACYCHLCFFDSAASEHQTTDYEMELGRNGNVRVPLDTTFYHLVRLFHVSLSCVGCGQCGDVCPVDIPLGAMAVKTSGAVQQAFGYVPGKSITEELPATAFKPDEFAGVL